MTICGFAVSELTMANDQWPCFWMENARWILARTGWLSKMIFGTGTCLLWRLDAAGLEIRRWPQPQGSKPNRVSFTVWRRRIKQRVLNFCLQRIQNGPSAPFFLKIMGWWETPNPPALMVFRPSHRRGWPGATLLGVEVATACDLFSARGSILAGAMALSKSHWGTKIQSLPE